MIRQMGWGLILLGLLCASSAFSQSHYLVIGVIHSKKPSDSVALLKDKTTGKTFAARIGQRFEKSNTSLEAIGTRSVDLRTGDRRLTLRIGSDDLYSTTASTFPANNWRDNPAIEVSGSNVEISESYRDHIVKNELAKVLMQAAAIPHFNGDQLSGFKLWNIEPGSVYEQVGFKDGDIVTSINGQDLIDVGSTIRLLHVLKEESAADVTIDRDGRQQLLNIRIK